MAAFTPGNLVVYRVGSGADSLVNTGNAVFVDEYTSAGTLVQSIALPTTASGANFSLIASGTASSEGLLTLSADGQFLLLTGYGTTTGGAASLSGTTAAAVPRVVGRVDASGNIDTSTALTDFASGNNPRGATSTNGVDIWVTGGAGGVRYTAFDGDAATDTSVQLSTTLTNLRAVEIFNGQLYVSTSSGSAVRIGTVGTGTPTSSGQTITNLPGFPTSGSPYAFFFADLTAAVAGVDTLYVAEDTASGGQVQKYSLVSGSWVANGAIADPAVRGLTASVSGSSVTIYTTTGGTSATGGGSLDTFTDTSGYNATITGTLTHLASAATNTAFRGVAFAPSAPDGTPPTLNATSPTDDATGVAANANIVLTFSETVKAGSGDITITDGGGDVRTIAISDPQVTISGSTVTINPTADLNSGVAYDVIIPSGVITDIAGNPFAGIAQDALDFTIAAAATVSIADASIAEGDAGTTVLTFTVTRSDNAGTFTVDYTTADGTAAAGSDYVPVTGAPNTIQFTAGGALTQQISITINGDTTAEPNQTFFVNLGNLVNATGTATISDGQAIGTIVNDDAAPVMINEIDADQPSTDTAEFIELVGGANMSLNGYVVVLYNGSNDQSYAAFDLDGLSFDANGYFLLGNSAVAGAAAAASHGLVFANNTLQNGADAVAVYLGQAADFPNGTTVTATNLVDAVVYENNHPDDRGLIDVLTPGQSQVNEAERGAGAAQSLQRLTDGAGGAFNTSAFTQAAPTPGGANVLPATPAAGATVTHLIHDVQGPGAVSPLSSGTVVTIEGIVVGDFQSGDSEVRRSLNGFYLEEENADWDADALSSEGIFIFGGTTDVHEGDLVRVTGTVSEFFGMTEVSVTGVTVVSTGNALPTVVDIDLPTAAATLNQNNRYQPDLEAYEGMYVRIPETLTITEQFQLDRFNEIKLSANGQLETFTNEFEPSTPGYAAYLQQIGARTITYDDGQNTQNESISYLSGFDPDDDGVGPSATFPGEPGYNTANAFRMGDTVTNLTGVLDYQFGGDATASGATWRIRAINDGDNTFTHANPRPDAPPIVGGTLKVASFNVLNYFTTLDAGGATTAIGLAPRGANTSAEFQRQTDKLVNFIATLDADVLGLTELENDFFDSNPNDSDPEGNAIAYLVGQLNARLGANTYAWIDPGSQLDSGQFFGGDAIAVGFIYKPSKVEVAFGTTIQKLDDGDAEAAALLGQSTIGHIFNGVNTSRASLAVTFHEIATNEDFTAVINHFKSKSGNGTGVDADQGDGQGAWQNQRELAAQALTQWIATHPTGTSDDDVLLLGDFNAYLKEDAVDLIEAGGFHNLAEERIADPNSFVFDAQSGALDHGFASNSLDAQVTAIDEWHANADEADALDYNLDFDRDPRYFDPLSVARESDHDPVVLGLALNAVAPTLTASTPVDNATDVAIGANIVLTFSEAVQAGTGNIILRPATGADVVIPIGSGQVAFSGNQVTINPTNDLRPGVGYDVIIGSGVITGLGGDPFGGIAQDDLDFTTSFTIPAGTFSQTFTISDPGTFTLLSGTTRTQTAGTAVQATVSAGSTTIDIEGTLNDTASGQRAINATLSAGGQITIGPNGSVQSLNADAIRLQAPNATVNFTNLGQVIAATSITSVVLGGPNPGTGFALQYNAILGAAGAPASDFTSGGIITNGAVDNTTALIQSNSGDAIRLGSHQTLINYGAIKGNGPVNDSSTNNSFSGTSTAQTYDVSRGVRFNQSGGASDKIENYGLIEGAQHAVDVGQANISNLIITNHATGTILGHNGSGVGADTTGAAADTVVVENFGMIRGEYAPTFDRAGLATVDGDGDGVDVDGAATIINHAGATIAGSGAGGVLAGQGAGGFDSNGRANRSEGISIGGGLITNDGLISGANFAITVNNDANPNNSRSGVLATTVANNVAGTIIGQNGFAIRLENKTGTAAIDNDTIVNFGSIIGTGAIPDPNGTVLRQDGVADPGTAGTLDGVTYTSAGNAGNARFISGDGSAIQMGEGDDVLTNHGTITGNTGRALNMEGGTDTLNLFTEGAISGRIDGGAGTDTINLLGSGTATLANVINVESLAVQSGIWTINDTQAYSAGVTVAGGLLKVDGSLGASSVAVNAGTLGGNGATGAVTVASGGTLSPGASAGTLSTGSLSLASGATLVVELGGAGAGEFDRVNVTGTVNLAGAVLAASLIGGFDPETSGTTGYTIISNDAGDAVTGAFSGLAEGAFLMIGSSQFTISYQGGDGNDVVLTAVNNAPENTVPPTQSVGANGSLSLSGLSIQDPDAQSGTMTMVLAVAHGTIAVGAAGGASVAGGGTGSVTLTGTLAQINATLAASDNVVYTPTHDFVGNDTLTVTSSDNGNTGAGGALIDSDLVKIVVTNPVPQAPPQGGTPGDDAFTAPTGSAHFDGFGGIDTMTFDFRLVDAVVSYLGNTVAIDGPSSHTVLTGFERFVFTDGTVDNNDGNPLVDDLFYYSRNHDVWNAHASADDHYNSNGWHEGRDPDAFFSTIIYLSANPDVKAAGVNPLAHFHLSGWSEGRTPSLTFDPRQYLDANPDVAAAHVDPLAHFLTSGAGEGRQPFAPSELIGPGGFDYVYYLQHNPDVAAAHVDPLLHFQTFGWKEGRNPNALFDVNGYLATYGDVAAAHVNPLDHYNQFGWHEGRDPSVGFDTTAYLAAYADVAAANVNPLTHFLHFGIHEGRSPFADGVWG